MASNTAKLSAMLTADPSGFISGMARAGKSLTSFQRLVRSIGRGFGLFLVAETLGGWAEAIDEVRAKSVLGEVAWNDYVDAFLKKTPLLGSAYQLLLSIGDAITGTAEAAAMAQARADLYGVNAKTITALARQLQLLRANNDEQREALKIQFKYEQTLTTLTNSLEKFRKAEESLWKEAQARYEQGIEFAKAIRDEELKALAARQKNQGPISGAGAFERSSVRAFQQAESSEANARNRLLGSMIDSQNRANNTLRSIYDFLRDTTGNVVTATPGGG